MENMLSDLIFSDLLWMKQSQTFNMCTIEISEDTIIPHCRLSKKYTHYTVTQKVCLQGDHLNASIVQMSNQPA